MKWSNLNVFSVLETRHDQIITTSKMEIKAFMDLYKCSSNGLNPQQIEINREQYGSNIINVKKEVPFGLRLLKTFIDPFSCVLIFIGIVSYFTDIVFAGNDQQNYATVLIISIIVLVSGLFRFVQENRSGKAAAALNSLVTTTIAVKRAGLDFEEISIQEIVVGDLIRLSAGDMVCCDMRIIASKDLFINQASLNGESKPVEKNKEITSTTALLDSNNIAFMGSNVVSGFADCIAIAVGNETMFGKMSKSITSKKATSSFEYGVQSVSWLLIRFMLIMVPLVFLINGISKGNWLEAFLFALSVAVGLTPEMLPMIVTTNLAKGARTMAGHKTIIKNLSSIQNFGSMDVLCTDKTGTLTQDKVVLEYYLDVHGKEAQDVLKHAFLNSYYQTGLRNLMDVAILAHGHDAQIEHLIQDYQKIDELPFDFNRRRMSVVLQDINENVILITKGAAEEMLDICSYAYYEGEIVLIDQAIANEVKQTVKRYNEEGLRVIAVAQKDGLRKTADFTLADEKDLILMGYLAFYDPPKETAKAALQALDEYGVHVKVLTGDNDIVTRSICQKVGLATSEILLGFEIEKMSEETLCEKVETIDIFAKLSPEQKTRIVMQLRKNGHVVGFMGDGINDAPAMRQGDVSISVDSGADIAKESADIILLEKDLMVLKSGVIEGRKIFGNLSKYIKMTASSNFGNMISVLLASIFLPFLPMLPIQILMMNLVYDFSCLSIPWDKVDNEYLKKPKIWDTKAISKFMLWFGPVSSIFDVITFLILFFILCPLVTGVSFNGANASVFIMVFHAGWFVESMCTQTCIVHTLRTEKKPFIKSIASPQVLLVTSLSALGSLVLPFTPLGEILGMHPLPFQFYLFLILILGAYMYLASMIKKIYIKKYGSLL